jgi:GNAT superfamily N-acetyltransferase
VVKDVCNGSAYVMDIEGLVVATITLDQQQDAQYKDIHWHIHDYSPLVIHRLAVTPEFQGRGIAGTLCRFAEQLAREQGCKSVRLDAYSLNPSSNHLYNRLGYKRASGFCYFHYNPVPFYCYDKILE